MGSLGFTALRAPLGFIWALVIASAHGGMGEDPYGGWLVGGVQLVVIVLPKVLIKRAPSPVTFIMKSP